MKKHFFHSILVFSLALLISSILFESPENLASAAGPEFLKKTIEGEDVNSFSNSSYNEQQNELIGKKLTSGGLYPAPKLERVNLGKIAGNKLALRSMPDFETSFNGKMAGVTEDNEFVFYTLDKKLQEFAKELVRKADAPHLAVVAMDPSTGRILAIADKSTQIKDLALHSGFPAASLFKIVTTAAALETTTMSPDSMVRFRGGTYTLNKFNYLPISNKDRRIMSVTEALALSCNAVFGRIGLQYLSPGVLRRYVDKFGFNNSIGFEGALNNSAASVPESDYELSRTAAGFGDINISPVHAAALMSGIANDGLMPRPYVISSVLSQSGKLEYQAKPQMIRQIVSSKTANTLLTMMESTTTMGTSKSEFIYKRKQILPVSVAAKTGTLSGTNPQGLNHWFLAAAPADNPKIAVSVISVNPTRTNAKASRIGRQIIEKYLGY
jgi:peptidoglycan glycosyltransferase